LDNGTTSAGQKYKTPKKVIDLLTDIVSKNGNLLLNFPLPNSGELDFEEREVLEGITRPGCRSIARAFTLRVPGRLTAKVLQPKPSSSRATSTRTSNRPHRRRCALYHEGKHDLRIRPGLARERGSCAGSRPRQPAAARQNLKVELLGNKGDVNWQQSDSALRVQMPAEKISDIGITLKVRNWRKRDLSPKGASCSRNYQRMELMTGTISRSCGVDRACLDLDGFARVHHIAQTR